MSLSTIVVSLNHEQRVPDLLAAAALIARDRKVHVTGLYVVPPLFVPSDVVFPMGRNFYREQISAHRDQCERVRAQFEARTKGETFTAEWRVRGDLDNSYEFVADGLIAESYAADLVIVSQAGGKEPPMLSEIPQRVALESGRPVLIIPTTWTPKAYGSDVAIAWNNSRESARATFDALPLLQKAEKVRLITVQSPDGLDGPVAVPSADVAATLARQGLNVDIETIESNGWHTGNAILSRVATDGADLLVMGAYGHSRFSEAILGGATRDVLRNMTVPVLMSH
jgi:nucleotide-binding universal stress UspA family protein